MVKPEVKSYITCANSKKMLEYSQVKLIEEVEKRPGLWSGECQGGRDEKLTMWKEVGAAMFKDWNECSKATAYDRVLQLQRKWRSLRDAYKREIRGRKSGNRVAKTTYRYFKIMSFLGGFSGLFEDTEDHEENNTHIDSKDSCTMEIEALDENLDYEDSNADPLDQVTVMSTSKPKQAVVKKPKRKVKKRQSSSEDSSDREETELPVYTYEMNEIEQDTETDSDKLFLMSFLPEMKQLPLDIKMWVRAQIARTMQEAVSCHYNNTTPTAITTGIKRQRHGSSD